MTHSEILRHYYLNSNPFANKFTVRPGYYFITNEFIESDDNKILVKAFYHPFKTTFLPESIFTINLKPLYNYHSVSDFKGIPTEHLVNAIIKIDSIKIVDGFYNDKPTKSYGVTWELIDYGQITDVLIDSPLIDPTKGKQGNSISAKYDSSADHTEPTVGEISEQETEPPYDPEQDNELFQLLYDQYVDPNENEEFQLLYDEYILSTTPTLEGEHNQLLYDEHIALEQSDALMEQADEEETLPS